MTTVDTPAPERGAGCSRLLGATSPIQYLFDAFEMMEHMLSLHPNDEPNRDPLHLPVRIAQQHRTIPCFRDLVQHL